MDCPPGEIDAPAQRDTASARYVTFVSCDKQWIDLNEKINFSSIPGKFIFLRVLVANVALKSREAKGVGKKLTPTRQVRNCMVPIADLN